MSANLLSIAEQAWKQLFPKPSDETAISKAEFIATAKSEYALQMWSFSKNEKNQEGVFNVPSVLLSEVELEVKDNVMDISGLEILRSLTNDSWVQNIGGLTCSCPYVKTNVNQAQLLCGDDSLPDNARTYLVVGNQVRFPLGVHKTPLTIMYANRGEKVDGKIEIDDAIGGILRSRLIEIYGGKMGKEDDTNNSNPNT